MKWILKLHDQEVENYRISDNPEKLKQHITDRYKPEKISFTGLGGKPPVIWLVDTPTDNIGVIAPVEEI